MDRLPAVVLKAQHRALLAAIALMTAVPAWACDFYVSEIRKPGLKRTATFEGENIVVEWGSNDLGRQLYTPIPEPVGPSPFAPWRSGVTEDNSDTITYRRYKDILIVDMEVFEPACDQTSQ